MVRTALFQGVNPGSIPGGVTNIKLSDFCPTEGEFWLFNYRRWAKIYFAGDMFNQSGINVTTLEVDYALIPVDTFYTFGPREALAFAKQFKKIETIIPMHYQKTPETKDEFTRLAVGGI